MAGSFQSAGADRRDRPSSSPRGATGSRPAGSTGGGARRRGPARGAGIELRWRLRRRCGGGVHGLLLGLGAAAASARTLPPSSSQRPASHRAWVARLSIMIAPTRSAIRRRPVDPRPSLPSFRDARSSPSPRSLNARRPAPAHLPSRDGARRTDRPGRRPDTGAPCRPRISDGAIRPLSLAVPARSAPPPAAGASRGSPTRRARCYSTKTTKTTITTITNAATAMVRVSMRSSLRSIARWREHPLPDAPETSR
jgi:hypothetical protein